MSSGLFWYVLWGLETSQSNPELGNICIKWGWNILLTVYMPKNPRAPMIGSEAKGRRISEEEFISPQFQRHGCRHWLPREQHILMFFKGANNNKTENLILWEDDKSRDVSAICQGGIILQRMSDHPKNELNIVLYLVYSSGKTRKEGLHSTRTRIKSRVIRGGGVNETVFTYRTILPFYPAWTITLE